LARGVCSAVEIEIEMAGRPAPGEGTGGGTDALGPGRNGKLGLSGLTEGWVVPGVGCCAEASGHIEDEQLIVFGLFAVAACLGDTPVLVIEAVSVGHDFLIRGDRHDPFPAIVQHGDALHGVTFPADDDIALHGIVDEALLPGVVIDLEGVLVVVFAGQPAGGEIGDGGGGAACEA
jgi:hypothetical protein